MPESAEALSAAEAGPELFVYYRVALADAAALGRAVQAMQDALSTAHPGLQTRLLRRPEASQGRLTFMEVYARPAQPDGVDSRLRGDIETAALALRPWLDGERHNEVFLPCA